MPCFARFRGKLRPVKNLGWFLSHWRDVERFEVKLNPLSLKAHDKEGYLIFSCSFGSSKVLWDFLDRPVFRGLEIDWNGTEQVCGGIKPDFLE